MAKVDLNWFAMEDLIRLRLGSASWIVLRQLEVVKRETQHAEVGFIEEFHGVASAMFPKSAARRTGGLDYTDLNSTWPHRPWIQDGRYHPAGSITPAQGTPGGKYLVLEQSFDGHPVPDNWHLDQDLILGLGLVRQGDKWIAPAEDGVVAAELFRSPDDGRPLRMQIRSEFLRDFLTARDRVVGLASYMSRRAVVAALPEVPWVSGETRSLNGGQWQGYIRAVHANGMPYGEKVHVVRLFRNDVDEAEDAPTVDMFDGKVESEQFDHGYQGGPYYFVEGELRRSEWFYPGTLSVRVRGDREPLDGIRYKVAADGSTASADDLQRPPMRWLYFRPEVVRTFTQKPSGSLGWHTADTGEVSYQGSSVHFGINPRGLVNVAAKDVAVLPAGVQRHWVAHNVTPDGPISQELLAAQMRADPADTVAPEDELVPVLEELDRGWVSCFGERLVRPIAVDQHVIASSCSRFQALSDSELPRLAKDLHRYVVERFDDRLLARLSPPWTGSGPDTRRSLVRIREILTVKGVPSSAVSRLQALNTLRQADSHIPSSGWGQSVADLAVPGDAPFPHKSKFVVAAVVEALRELAVAVRRIPSREASRG